MLGPPRSWEMPARALSRPPSEKRGNDGVPVRPAPPSRPPRNHGEEDEGVVESAIEQVFSAYRCLSLGVGCRAHPGQVAESASLASISPPPLTYPLDAFPPDLISRGTLSGLQLEGAASACAQHLRWLPCGTRAGFFLGDGAGVGKGRQVAAVIADNFVRGRTRALWVSSSGDLSADAARDLKDLGCFIPMHVGSKALGKASWGSVAPSPSGVLFLTYATLSSQGGCAGQRRLDQVVSWLGGSAFEGALVLDECHRAKNCVPGRPEAGTRVAQAVLELQAALPRARVLYCSATGVSEIGDLAYMSRLGLWGPGSAFRDFGAFLDSVRRRGVSFMELLAMELKKEGLYLSRGLSFQDASFALLDCPLSASQARCYGAAASLWRRARDALVEAVVATGAAADAWKPFYGAQQRFFKLLLVSFKVPAFLREARRALAAGECVVVGLQSTGEAALDALGLAAGSRCAPISACRETLVQFLNAHFPVTASVAAAEFRAGEAGGAPASLPRPPPALHAPSFEVRADLLRSAAALPLPENALDAILAGLGGPGAVAELTGRRARVVRRKGVGLATGEELFAAPEDGGATQGAPECCTIELRGSSSGADGLEGLNLREQAAFQGGRKLVAVVSEAASTGISLHADARASNQRRRVHLTLELPWSADRAIQQLGRSHRAGQVRAPAYGLLCADVGGERRFVSAVARRLASLGALTRGDRRAASGLDLARFDYDSPLGRSALKRMADAARGGLGLLPRGVGLSEVLLGEERTEDGEEGEDEAYRELVEALLCVSLRPPPPASSLRPRLVAALRSMGADRLVACVRRLHVATRAELEAMGLLAGDGSGSGASQASAGAPASAAKAPDVRRFFNRMLALAPARQRLLFGYFSACLAAEARAERAAGREDLGLSELAGRSAREAGEPRVLWAAERGGAATLAHSLLVDRGLDWEAAARILRVARGGKEDDGGDGGEVGGEAASETQSMAEAASETQSVAEARDSDPAASGTPPEPAARVVSVSTPRLPLPSLSDPDPLSGFWQARRGFQGRPHVLLAILQPSRAASAAEGPCFQVWRPGTGLAPGALTLSDLEERHVRLARSAARALWEQAYEAAGSCCAHGPDCQFRNCPVGRRETKATVLTGALVRAWPALESALARRAEELPRGERALRVVRVRLEGRARPLVGVRYPDVLLADAAALLWGGGRPSVDKAGGEKSDWEAVSPVQPRLFQRAFTAPKTVLDFFKPVSAPTPNHNLEENGAPKTLLPLKRSLQDGGAPDHVDLVSDSEGEEALAPDLRTIKDMGFGVKNGREALKKAGGRLEHAMEILLASQRPL